ncbi:hypothetical protein NP284_08640 [Rhodopseudomonas pseudopalustris]|uniref:hypothetical protein n=1 Tax=Rhodopseudomonas pseudopalustris TaxID=1513892 RepID=UPI003F9E3C4D
MNAGITRTAYGDTVVMARKTESSGEPRSSREDGRKQFLTYMRTDLIKEIKKAALDQERNAYELVEDAVEEYLRRPHKKRT